MHIYIYIYIIQAAPNVRLPRTCHFCACRARRGSSQCLAKSSPYAGPSAGTEVARLRKWQAWYLLAVYQLRIWNRRALT